jgi:predicted O-methyltransferase YrrM
MTFQDLQGFCTAVECMALLEAARDRLVLEVGCWKARSTVAMASAAQHVFAVDTFHGDSYTGEAWTLPEAYHNVKMTGMLPRVTLVAGNYFDIHPQLNLAAFDMAFYDADHDGEPTRLALETFKRLPHHALVAVHDYEPAYPQVVGVVDAFAREGGYEIRVVERLALLQRKA